MKPVTTNNTILIIENDLNIARRIVTLCFALGYVPLLARDGFTGILLAKAARPRMIFSDVSLPGLDGFQLVRRIKELVELHDTPVVAISATFPGHAADDVAFDDCLLKPINDVRLKFVIDHACEHVQVA